MKGHTNLSHFGQHSSAVVLSLVVAAIALVTTLVGDEAIATSVTEMLIRMTLVVGLYIFIGNSGITSFGHVAFSCLGAYAVGWATAEPMFKQIMLSGLPTFLQENQYPFWMAMIGSALLPAVVALLFGLAIMRLNGIAASIASFAFLIIVNSVFANWDSVTAGVSSIIGIPTIVGPWVATGGAIFAILVANLFQTSRFGIMLRACRDDEVAAKASGVRVVRVRLTAFVLSAAVAGVSGGLYAQFLGILAIDAFYLNLTFIALAMLVVGGVGSLTGAVSGVVVVTVIVEVLRFLERGFTLGSTSIALPPGSQEIGLGIIMALILIFRPGGIAGGRELFALTGRKRHSEKLLADASQTATATH
ncbi:branched-chain amino acid ABC transporter permease [Rhizobium leguminosarum]|uniref:branched-chain amino acid ABC transporter permease n=1 Tax=Rhizobium leguminosarum TaxID=384 RepID=UPI0013D8E7B6|nr:branched-chain amino acid ABC transporter permease [Rhizobium leguminosarum]NEK38146.1 branched-chain amino acid ABC transporter permease [Rhizobium leguminosarum]